MIKRSLNTYMNAWTGPDFTAYPFSTYNKKDYYNLLHVYTDAVFKPLLNYYDFLQVIKLKIILKEGWRYSLNTETNAL